MNIEELLKRQDEIMKFVNGEMQKLQAIGELSQASYESRVAWKKASLAILDNVIDVLGSEEWETVTE